MKPENVFYLIAVLVVALSAVSHSQSNASKIVKAEIPFEFVLGDTTFQPGPYEVSVTWQGTVWLKGHGASTKAINSQVAASFNSANQTKLVFRHVGKYYFLEQIWKQGDATGREIPPTQLEKEIMSRVRPERVEVLARK